MQPHVLLEVRRNYRRTIGSRPTPWRWYAEHCEVRDANQKTICTVSDPHLAALIVLIPDMIDPDFHKPLLAAL